MGNKIKNIAMLIFIVNLSLEKQHPNNDNYFKSNNIIASKQLCLRFVYNLFFRKSVGRSQNRKKPRATEICLRHKNC